MQFVRRYGRETSLLQLARELERVCPWAHTAPLVNNHLDQE